LNVIDLIFVIVWWTEIIVAKEILEIIDYVISLKTGHHIAV